MSAAKKTLHESDILKPRDFNLADTNEWPEFHTSEVTIFSSSNPSTPTSLLTAGEHNPLMFTGTLEPLRKDQAHLWTLSQKQRPKPPISIQVTDILNYSYGAYNNGKIELWAAGKAGWFVVKPSKRYRPIYNEMIEAVEILFFIVDAYSTPRKSGKGKNATILPDFTAQEVFEEYAIKVMGVAKGAPEAAKKMYKHKEFLLSIMLEGREGIIWSKNPLYLHLCRKFSDVAKGIRQRMADSVAKAKEAERVQREVSVQHKRQPSLESVSTNSSLKRKRGRPPKDSSSIGSASVDTSVIELQPPQLVSQQTEKKQTPAIKPQSTSTRSTRSNPTPSTPEIQESRVTTPARQESDSEASNTNRRKSALRLKPNKPTKGPPKSSRLAPRLSQSNDDRNAEDESEDELSSAGAAPITAGPNKRKKGDSYSQPTQQSLKSKAIGRNGRRTNNKPASGRAATDTVDEGIDIPSSPESDAIAGDEGTEEELALRLLHKPDQLQQDVWTCALDGCTHKVYASPTLPLSNPDTQKMIREHYALHAYDDDERVRLVKAVAEPSLPVNHLIERVRGQVRLEGMSVVGPSKTGVGTRFPEALVTKF